MKLSVPLVFDKDHVYVADMTEHSQLDETMEGLVDYGTPLAAATGSILAATAIIAAGILNVNKKVDDYYGRTIQVTSTAAGTLTIYGRDYLNQQMTQQVTAVVGTVTTTKAFKFIDRIVSGTVAGNVSLGIGTKFGVPFVVSELVKEYDDGLIVAVPTLTNPDTATPSATTGEIRGTVTPTAAINGVINVQMKMRFNQDAVGGLYGRAQA